MIMNGKRIEINVPAKFTYFTVLFAIALRQLSLFLHI